MYSYASLYQLTGMLMQNQCTLLSAVNKDTQQTQTYKMKVRSGISPSRWTTDMSSSNQHNCDQIYTGLKIVVSCVLASCDKYYTECLQDWGIPRNG